MSVPWDPGWPTVKRKRHTPTCRPTVSTVESALLPHAPPPLPSSQVVSAGSSSIYATAVVATTATTAAAAASASAAAAAAAAAVGTSVVTDVCAETINQRRSDRRLLAGRLGSSLTLPAAAPLLAAVAATAPRTATATATSTATTAARPPPPPAAKQGGLPVAAVVASLSWLLWAAVGGVHAVDLYIAGFFPTTVNLSEGSIGRGVVPAVRLALDHINNATHFLPGYTLAIRWNDTQCDPAVGMKSFFDMIHSHPKKLALFGAACNAVTDPIAKASKFFELIQLSYADTHPMYSAENYPNFFRVVPSEAAFNPAMVSLLKFFNWTRVGSLYQTEPRHSLPQNSLHTELDREKITIDEIEGIGEGDDITDELAKLREIDVRIILGNFNEEWARKVFCSAYRSKMYGRKYQWIIAAMYQPFWWRVPQADVTCSPEEFEEVLLGYIGLDLLPLSTNENITVSGWTPSEYKAQYDKLRHKEYSRFHGYAYDGIWTLALAIHSVIIKLRAQETAKSSTKLTDFDYRNSTWGRLFRESLNETDFVGVTGPVRFFKNDRKGQVMIKQFQKIHTDKGDEYDEVTIGEFDCLGERLDLSKGRYPILWREGRTPPKDRSQEVIERTRVNPTMYAVVSVTCVVGICLATVFLAINIRFRNQRYIKMSSPYLNNLIIVGCMLTYTSVILLGMDSGFTSVDHFPYICAARAWVLMSGFTLAFGAMFSKTWRVHAIFTNIKLNKKVIKDYKLFMVVGVFLLLDITILTTWQIVDPFYRDVKRGDPVTSDEDISVVPEMEYCQSDHMTIFLGIVYGYKGLLMIFGCFLAWETRHVSIPALNDSKYVGMSVYNVVIMCSIGAAISFVLRDHQDAAFLIISVFIIFCSTTTLCLVFVPKLVELRRNPAAGEQRVRAALKPLKKRSSFDEDTNANRITQLQNENTKCRTRLEEKSKELQQLVAQLNQPDPVKIVVTNSHNEPNLSGDSNACCAEDSSNVQPISTIPEVGLSSSSQIQSNYSTSQDATTQEYNPGTQVSQAFQSHRHDSAVSISEDTDNLVYHHMSDSSRKLSMASLQGSLLVATSILEGAVNACSNVGNVESTTPAGGTVTSQAAASQPAVADQLLHHQHQQKCLGLSPQPHTSQQGRSVAPLTERASPLLYTLRTVDNEPVTRSAPQHTAGTRCTQTAGDLAGDDDDDGIDEGHHSPPPPVGSGLCEGPLQSSQVYYGNESKGSRVVQMGSRARYGSCVGTGDTFTSQRDDTHRLTNIGIDDARDGGATHSLALADTGGDTRRLTDNECTCLDIFGTGGAPMGVALTGGGSMDSRIRRRAKSLGALRQPAGTADYSGALLMSGDGGRDRDAAPADIGVNGGARTGGGRGSTCSQIDSGTNSGTTLRAALTASSQFLPYLFLNQNALAAAELERSPFDPHDITHHHHPHHHHHHNHHQLQHQNDYPQYQHQLHHPYAAASGATAAATGGLLSHQDRAALFASYPSVKCDIVEYL